MNHDSLIGIDPGSEVSGLCLLKNNIISSASVERNCNLYHKIKELSGGNPVTVVIEDMQPYFMRLTPQVIDTCKFIGEICYRLNTCDFVSEIHLIARNSVKKFLFDTVPSECLPRIEKKIAALDRRKLAKGEKGLRTKEGELRKPSFHYMGDREVIAALKILLGIPTPKPGKPNIYGLKAHSWQAAATAAYYSNQIVNPTTQ